MQHGIYKVHFKQTQQNLRVVSALLSSEIDSRKIFWHLILSFVASTINSRVRILNNREIFQIGKIGEERIFYVLKKWKIQKSREIFQIGKIGEEKTNLCSTNKENLKTPSLEPLQL